MENKAYGATSLVRREFQFEKGPSSHGGVSSTAKCGPISKLGEFIAWLHDFLAV